MTSSTPSCLAPSTSIQRTHSTDQNCVNLQGLNEVTRKVTLIYHNQPSKSKKNTTNGSIGTIKLMSQTMREVSRLLVRYTFTQSRHSKTMVDNGNTRVKKLKATTASQRKPAQKKPNPLGSSQYQQALKHIRSYTLSDKDKLTHAIQALGCLYEAASRGHLGALKRFCTYMIDLLGPENPMPETEKQLIISKGFFKKLTQLANTTNHADIAFTIGKIWLFLSSWKTSTSDNEHYAWVNYGLHYLSKAAEKGHHEASERFMDEIYEQTALSNKKIASQNKNTLIDQYYSSVKNLSDKGNIKAKYGLGLLYINRSQCTKEIYVSIAYLQSAKICFQQVIRLKNPAYTNSAYLNIREIDHFLNNRCKRLS